MKKIMLMIVTMLVLSGCTLNYCTRTYVDARTGEQYYSCKTIQRGTVEPVITIYSPYRTYVKR